MKKKTKNDYSKEFRDQAVSMVLKSDKPTAQIARELGVTGTTLYSWVKNKKASKPQDDEVTNEQLFDELKRLKKELAEVKEQRDILKKATVDSTGQCNAPFHNLFWCFKFQCFSGSFI